MICFKCNVLKEDACVSRKKIEMQKKGICSLIAGNSCTILCHVHLVKPIAMGACYFFVFCVNFI